MLTRPIRLGYDAQQHRQFRGPNTIARRRHVLFKMRGKRSRRHRFLQRLRAADVGIRSRPAGWSDTCVARRGDSRLCASRTTRMASAPAVAYAGFWLRLVAIIIDVIVLGFAGWIIFLPFAASMRYGMRGIFMGGRPQRPEDFFPIIGMMFRLAAIRTVLNWLYFSLLESSGWQATLGKKALGLEVTDLAGRRISFGRATGRFFAKYISAIILMIGFLMAGFTEKKQALHDILAGTLVIRKL